MLEPRLGVGISRLRSPDVEKWPEPTSVLSQVVLSVLSGNVKSKGRPITLKQMANSYAEFQFLICEYHRHHTAEYPNTPMRRHYHLQHISWL